MDPPEICDDCGEPGDCLTICPARCSYLLCQDCEVEHADEHRIAAKDDRDAEYVWGDA